jgi:two-component system, cell cycle sensor histidine kinase and response regulator CckA
MMTKRNLDATREERVPAGRIILVITIVLAVFAIMGFSYYTNEKTDVYEKIGNELKSIAVLKSAQLAHWYDDELKDAELIAGNGILATLINEWLNGDDARRRLTLERYLTSLRQEHGYHELFLYAPVDGHIIVSRPTNAAVNDVMLACADRALELNRAQTTDIYIGTANDSVYIDVIAPIQNTEGLSPILLVCRFSPTDVLFPHLDRWPIERNSAESYIISQVGDSLLVQSNLRFRAASAASLFLPRSDTALGVVHAFQNPGKLTEGLDYRGVESLTFVCEVPGSPWFLVTETDRAEALEGFHSDVRMIIGYLILIIIILIIGMAWYYSNRQRIMYQHLARLQQELRTLLDSMADAVIITGTDSRITHFNPAAEALTCWKARDVIGKNFDEICTLMHERTGEAVESPITRALRQNTAEGFANGILLVTAEGNKIPVMESISAIGTKEKSLSGVAVLYKDQTEQRSRQRLLEESEIKFRSLFETTSDAIALWRIIIGENTSDIDAELLDCNERFAALLGTVAAHLSGRPLHDCSVFDLDTMRSVLREVASSRTPSVIELHSLSLQRHFIVTVYAPSENRVAMMLHDFTERKIAENSLISKIEELERFNHLVVDRELRMIELKQEVNDLLQSTGQAEKYRIIK